MPKPLYAPGGTYAHVGLSDGKTTVATDEQGKLTEYPDAYVEELRAIGFTDEPPAGRDDAPAPAEADKNTARAARTAPQSDDSPAPVGQP